MTITTKRIGLLIWALIYGGLFALAIGLSLERAGEPHSWIFIGGGAVAIGAGVVLLWIRSRMAAP